jgi:hypothetical protein
MFRAKLIENKDYYKLRRKHLLLMFLPFIPIALLVNFYQIPIWLTILMIALYVAANIIMVRNHKQLSLILGNRLIEIGIDEIRIKSKNVTEEIIKLNKLEKILLKDEYSIHQETIKEVGQELTGKTRQNYIILHQNNKARQFDFEIDSYYMINQLNKVIESWKMKGYTIERINEN